MEHVFRAVLDKAKPMVNVLGSVDRTARTHKAKIGKRKRTTVVVVLVVNGMDLHLGCV